MSNSTSTIQTATLIIGANRGIGLGLTREALKAQPQATIYATARDLEKATELQKLKSEHGDRLVLLKLDMLDEASVEVAAATLKQTTSTLELLIVNAGVALGGGALINLKSDEFLQNLNANVVGPHNILKAFYSFLTESKAEKKTVVFMSSIAGSIAALPDVTTALKGMFKTDFNPMSGYSVTKVALNGLGRHWSEVLEPKGVAVALVHPGAVATDMNPGEGTIPVSESATGIFKLVEGLKIEDGAKGILSYDGTIYPW